MKTIYASLFHAFLLLRALSGASLAADSGGIDFHSIPVENADATINSISGARRLKEFAAAAMESKRIDLIQACFQNQYTMEWIREEAMKLPDTDFKNEAVLMMLKAESPFWAPEPEVKFGNQGVAGTANLHPFSDVAKKYLPGVALDETIYHKRALRMQLAAQIEKAIAKEKEKKTVLQTPTPSISEHRPAREEGVPNPGTSAETKYPNATPTTTPIIPPNAGHERPGLFLGGLIVVGVSVLGWYFLRKR